MQSGLLERVAGRLGKSYLSDLRSTQPRKLLAELRLIAPEEYSVREWNYALSYIFSGQVEVSSLENLDSVLQELLEETNHCR